MTTCPRIPIMADHPAFQPSKTTVKAVADSTEPRPRRSRANYKVKDSGKEHLQRDAPEKHSDAKTDVMIYKRKAQNGAVQNMWSNRHQNVTVPRKSSSKKELKKKVQRSVGPKQKKPKIVDSTSGDGEPFSTRDRRTFSTDSNQSGGCRDRLLMRQWLEAEADGENIPGLRWFNKNEKLIQITWRHGSRSEWSPSDVMVFKCWAEHTGRYNAHNKDYKRWKANFRCALNSLQDVKEVTEKRSTKNPDPYKVYRLLPAIPPKKRRRESSKSCNSSSAESTFQTPSTEETIQTDGIVGDLTDLTDADVDVSTPDLFRHLMPLSNSSGCEHILTWTSLDPVYDSIAGDTLETIDVPLTYLDHCYADFESLNQLPPIPSSPPSPIPFNDAIPVPVLDLIESSEEFQAITISGENIPVSCDDIPVSCDDIPVFDVLTGSCEAYVNAETNNIQACTISSTNDGNLDSIFQVIFNVPAFSTSCEIASLDQKMDE